jgi:hypothetical protein
MEITSKARMYGLYQTGAFGNKLRTWQGMESFLEFIDSGFRGTVTMRASKHWGGSLCEYNVPPDQVPRRALEWNKNHQIYPWEIQFNESAPDECLVVQGEVQDIAGHGLCLRYSREKAKMRDALKSPSHARRAVAVSILKSAMTPSSYEDLQALLDEYDGHCVEFSAYSKCLGHIKGRNTIIWECRKY